MLWEFLTAAALEDNTLAGVSVKEIMDTWTLQMNYPVVRLERNEESPCTGRLTQQRFLLTPESEEPEEPEYTWWVPLSFTTPSQGFDQTSPSAWLSPATANGSTLVDLCSSANLTREEPVILNVQQTGFYRVNYDQPGWELLQQTLLSHHSSLHKVNRAQLLDDALSLARASLLPYPTALQLTDYLGAELDYVPWAAAISSLRYLENMFSSQPGFGQLRAFLLRTLQPVVQRLGLEERPGLDTALEQKLRVLVVEMVCRLDLPECRQYSQALMEQWMAQTEPDSQSPFPSSTRDSVLCAAVAQGEEATWEFVLARYLASSNANEKLSLLTALACSRQVWILQRYLEMSLTEQSGVRKQDGYKIVVAVSNNQIGRLLAWDWLRSHWADLTTYYDPAVSVYVGRIISAVARDFNTRSESSTTAQRYNRCC